MKLGYLSIPPVYPDGRGPDGPRAGNCAGSRDHLAEALGFSEFYAASADPRALPHRANPERQDMLRIVPDRPVSRLPELVSVDGASRQEDGSATGLLAAPVEHVEDVRAQSFRGCAPLSVSWLDSDMLARHWAAHVTGCTHAARCARRQDWRVARTIVVDDDPARAEATAKAPDSPCRAYYRGTLSPHADDATVDALIDDCVLYGTQILVAARLQEMTEASGGFGTLTFVDHAWANAALARRSLILFSDAVSQIHQPHTQRKFRKLELA